MPFTVSGRRLGRSVSVRWADGELDGDDAVLLAVDDLEAAGAGVGLEPVGPWFEAGLEEPWRALLTILAALDLGSGVVEVLDLDEAELVPPEAELEEGVVA